MTAFGMVLHDSTIIASIAVQWFWSGFCIDAMQAAPASGQSLC